MKSVIVSMYEDQVWDLMDPPKGVKPIKRKWNYKVRDVDVHIHRKARLVINEFTIKFKELTTIRLDLS